MRKARRTFTPRQRLEIVLEGLAKDSSVAEVCRRHEISTTLFYYWRDQLFEGAERVFARPAPRVTEREAEHERETVRMHAVIAEITAENLELKKTRGAWPITPGSLRNSGR